MKKYTIEERFSAALNYAKSLKGRGFQADICRESDIDPSHLSGIINNRKGASEELRNSVQSAVTKILPDFPSKTYESFLLLGQHILDGKDPADFRSSSISIQIPAATIAAEGTVSSSNTDEPTPLQSLHVHPFEKKRPPRQIPVISYGEAGGFSEACDPFPPGCADEFIPFDEPCGPNTYALIVKGESMMPDFPPGMRIIVDPGLHAENGDLVIVKNGEDEATFKKLVYDGGQVFLFPLNKDYLPPRNMTGKEFHIAGVVIGRYESLRWSRRR